MSLCQLRSPFQFALLLLLLRTPSTLAAVAALFAFAITITDTHVTRYTSVSHSQSIDTGSNQGVTIARSQVVFPANFSNSHALTPICSASQGVQWILSLRSVYITSRKRICAASRRDFHSGRAKRHFFPCITPYRRAASQRRAVGTSLITAC